MNELLAQELTASLALKAGLNFPYCGTKDSIYVVNREFWLDTEPRPEVPNGHFPFVVTECANCGHIDLFNIDRFHKFH